MNWRSFLPAPRKRRAWVSGATVRTCLLAAASPFAGHSELMSLCSSASGQPGGRYVASAGFITMVIQWGLRPKTGRFIVGRRSRSLWIVGRWQTISQDTRGQAWVDNRPFGGVIGERYPPLEARKSQFEHPAGPCSSLRRTALWGTQWGQLDGPRTSGGLASPFEACGSGVHVPIISYSGLRAGRLGSRAFGHARPFGPR